MERCKECGKIKDYSINDVKFFLKDKFGIEVTKQTVWNWFQHYGYKENKHWYMKKHKFDLLIEDRNIYLEKKGNFIANDRTNETNNN